MGSPAHISFPLSTTQLAKSRYKTAIAVTDGFSEDRTLDLARLFRPHKSIGKIITRDMAAGGKGAGVRTIMELAHELDVRMAERTHG
ncbi:MAG: hypothetical protein R6U98_36470 [Pirellulaceae bacterium]